jgi:sec-independent protein translocase protein TatC
MSTYPNEAPDPEDMFNDTRMSFGDHIEDLRAHLIRALKGFLIGMVLGIWPLGKVVLGIITGPVEEQLREFEMKKVTRDFDDAKLRIDSGELRLPPIYIEIDLLKPGPAEKGKPVLEKTVRYYEKMLFRLEVHDWLDEELTNRGAVEKVEARIGNPYVFARHMMETAAQVRRPGLTTLSITEGFFVYFKVALLTGLVLSSPWVFYHVWMFIAAGLYPNEKRLVNVYLPFSLFLFIAGVVLCQFFVMSRAVGALLWFNEWLGLDADLRLNEWLGFALLMPLVFGVSFQTPLVMMFVHRIGVMSVELFREKRRIVWFSMSVFAALITPTPDPFTMLFLWVPMCGLYELGILLCVYQGEQTSLFDWEEEEEKKSGELVEV